MLELLRKVLVVLGLLLDLRNERPDILHHVGDGDDFLLGHGDDAARGALSSPLEQVGVGRPDDLEALDNAALFEDQPNLEVRISFDEEARTLTISDNGIGMSAEEAAAHLGTIARSGTREFLDTLKAAEAKEAMRVARTQREGAPLDRVVYNGERSDTTVEALSMAGESVATKQGSQMTLSVIDDALSNVNSVRADLGAIQNRLQSTINNLAINEENLAAANSRIRDTDMAEETSELTKASILTQATVSVLGQANQTPQLALKLIG